MTPTGVEVVWVAIDGDDVGRELERLIAADDLDGVTDFSHRVSDRIQALRRLAEEHGGKLAFAGGDNLLCRLPRCAAVLLCDSAVQPQNRITFSVGVAPEMSQAMLALKAAKAKGRRQYVTWAELIRIPDRPPG